MTDATAAALPPCRFRFDDGPTWEGFAHGSTWNGFDNVAATRETLERIADWAAETALSPADAEEARAQFTEIEPDPLWNRRFSAFTQALAGLGLDRWAQPADGPYGERAVARVIEGVDVASLDAERVRPHLGNSGAPGVWFPVAPQRANRPRARLEDGNCAING